MRPLIIQFLLLSAAALATLGAPNNNNNDGAATGRWSFGETLIVEDLHTSAHTTKNTGAAHGGASRGGLAYEAFLAAAGHRPAPAVIVSARLEGSAVAASPAEEAALLDLLPQGLSSLFSPVVEEGSSAHGEGKGAAAALRDFEWSLCGGRYKPSWPVVGPSSSSPSSAPLGADAVRSAIYRHQNHPTCGTSPITSCYATISDARNDTNAKGRSLVEESSVRAHHSRMLRHWGELVGTTNGIGGSVSEVHDRYGSGDTAGRALSADASVSDSPSFSLEDAASAAASLLRSPHYRSAAEYETTGGGEGAVSSTAAADTSTAASPFAALIGGGGGQTSGNRLIAAHVRPLGVQSAPSSSSSSSSPFSCFYDVSTMENLCTENLLPLLAVWGELAQMGEGGGSSEESLRRQRSVRRRLRGDEWAEPYDASRPRRAADAPSSYPTARRSVLEAAVPNAVFVLSTGYHSVGLRVASEPLRSADSGGAKNNKSSRLTVALDLTFVLSSADEVEAFRSFAVGQRGRELSLLAASGAGSTEKEGQSSGARIVGNAFAVSSNFSVDLRIGGAGSDSGENVVPALMPSSSLNAGAQQPSNSATSTASSACGVEASTVQFGEVRGELTLSVRCTVPRSTAPSSSSASSSSSPRVAIVESLLLLPAHTVNPLLSSATLTATGDPSFGDAAFEVLRAWYDPLSTVLSVAVRTTVPLPPSTSEVSSSSSSTSSTSSAAEAYSAEVRTVIPFRFPSLRLDHYPPDMNKAYPIPQVTSRVRIGDCASDEGGSADESFAVLHQRAVASMLDSAAVDNDDGADSGGCWQYQRDRTVSAVTLPLPDPGMVFNVLSLSSAIVALLVGRGVGIVLRRSIV